MRDKLVSGVQRCARLPTSQGRGGLGCMDSTLALGAFRIARGAGGEAVDVNGNLVEREKGDVWNRNSCVLIDYRLWAAKSEGRPWVDQCLDHHLNLHLNLGVGCAPSCCRFSDSETSWVLAGGAEGSFLCSLSSRFSGGGGGVGSPPQGVAASWGARRSRCLKNL